MWPLLYLSLLPALPDLLPAPLPGPLPAPVLMAPSGTDPMQQAFALADHSSTAPATAPDWQLSSELALASNALPGATEQQWQSRLALDSRFSQASADQSWNLRWNSRIDRFDSSTGVDSSANSSAGSSTVLSWKELYAGYRWNDSWLTEFGRINQKNGVARGFNPTDFFAAAAVRAQISQQPAVLREQRLGSLMLRQQWLGDAKSLSFLFSPKLSSTADNAALAPDWARTNSTDRWQLSAEQQLWQGWTLGVLAYQAQGEARQYGLNLSGALNERWLYHLEAASGNQPRWPAGTEHSNRLATGVSYSLTLPLTLTLEWQYDAAGLSQQAWQQLLQQPADWQHYLQQRQGQLPTRQTLLLQAQSQQWSAGFDWSALWLHDLQDNSDMLLTELTWIKPEYDIVLQWQWAPGPDQSHFGAVGSQLQLLWRSYF